MIPLGLHHLTATDLDPVDFVDVAAGAGCQFVSLFAQPLPMGSRFPMVTADNIDLILARLHDTGVQVANVDAFMLTPSADITHFRPALEIGARLGAMGATVLIYDSDEARVLDNLSRLCEATADFGLNANIEFTALSDNWNTIEQIVALVQQVAQPNLGIGVDVLHLVRSGGGPANVAAIPPSLIAYAQLCDGRDAGARQDYAEEAGSHRLAPGEGCFPLVSFLRALPTGTPLEIEVPAPPQRPARERVEDAVAATRRQLRKAGLS